MELSLCGSGGSGGCRDFSWLRRQVCRRLVELVDVLDIVDRLYQMGRFGVAERGGGLRVFF